MTAAKVDGDFSKYPAEIRELFPYIYGELCELRTNWEVYRELFMADRRLTETLSECYGSSLGILQRLLEEALFISIGCLTDKDSKKDKHLSMWALAEKCEPWNSTVGKELKDGLVRLDDKVSRIRKHRHKRIAHFDLSTSVGLARLPIVTYKDLEETMKGLEDLLNIVDHHAIGATILFDAIITHQLTDKLEVSAYKVKVYDDLVKRGVIPLREWSKFAIDRNEPL